MIEGIIWAVIAGITLGLYALPEKFTKNFDFENTWGMMFFINMFIVPAVTGFLLINGFSDILKAIPGNVLSKMIISGVLWGVGVMMWGKAINHIGVSLGFSIFIGTVILIGSLLPFLVDALPASNKFIAILIGIAVVLVGVIANGKAGMKRQKDEGQDPSGKGSMGAGISIAIVGGLLATAFSFANAVGRPVIHEQSLAAGNPEWVTAVGVMFIIYVSGGIFVVPYFIINLSTKKLWPKFATSAFGTNLALTSVMAVLNFAASAFFAFAAFKLGAAGNTVGYAIFNTLSVAVAILSGLITKEWSHASRKAKTLLYLGLACMIIGVVVIAVGNSFK
uniref:MS146, putative L-rhamnose transporter n=1 Tax=Microscilla sp. PRE1 TaxID=155537 RepID=Q93P85_9BACT|nr:L-rhamnose/proton symporter RhaT [Microscilla sp. PRE1]AAK62868.1 MS146, putative L-rhamnose transporter [Microscilla sp. PRE1]